MFSQRTASTTGFPAFLPAPAPLRDTVNRPDTPFLQTTTPRSCRTLVPFCYPLECRAYAISGSHIHGQSPKHRRTPFWPHAYPHSSTFCNIVLYNTCQRRSASTAFVTHAFLSACRLRRSTTFCTFPACCATLTPRCLFESTERPTDEILQSRPSLYITHCDQEI